jgi:hypothetical protein
MSHDDHAVENNPRKETLFAGVCLLMLTGIVSLIAFGGLARPVAPKDPMAILKTVPVGSAPTAEPVAVTTPAAEPAAVTTPTPAAAPTMDAPAATGTTPTADAPDSKTAAEQPAVEQPADAKEKA